MAKLFGKYFPWAFSCVPNFISRSQMILGIKYSHFFEISHFQLFFSAGFLIKKAGETLNDLEVKFGTQYYICLTFPEILESIWVTQQKLCAKREHDTLKIAQNLQSFRVHFWLKYQFNGYISWVQFSKVKLSYPQSTMSIDFS